MNGIRIGGRSIIANHLRSFEREQDIRDPLHYLPLLVQRPGAFEHAKPMRNWRKKLPMSYERFLQALRENQPDERGVQEFMEILKLHQKNPEEMVTQAIEMTLELGATHLDGVQLCLRQLLEPDPQALTLDWNPFILEEGYEIWGFKQISVFSIFTPNHWHLILKLGLGSTRYYGMYL